MRKIRKCTALSDSSECAHLGLTHQMPNFMVLCHSVPRLCLRALCLVSGLASSFVHVMRLEKEGHQVAIEKARRWGFGPITGNGYGRPSCVASPSRLSRTSQKRIVLRCHVPIVVSRAAISGLPATVPLEPHLVLDRALQTPRPR